MTTDLAISELAGAVDRPIAQATGLPNRAYTNPEFFELELDRIFAPSWACLGHAADIPSRGDLRPVQLLGVPLLMVRAGGGAVHVFHSESLPKSRPSDHPEDRRFSRSRPNAMKLNAMKRGDCTKPR